tara:strand:- start:3997 stop:5037 length:1041 start_codon:yes stop_codon:yes gene_type:complete
MYSFKNLKKKPYIIAEISSNHANKIDIALKTIEAAARAGADAIKTQLFTPSSLTIPDRSLSASIKDANSPWDGALLFDLYAKAALPYDWYPQLIKCAESNSIDIFSSVFDFESVDYLLKFKFPLVKISSFELIHIPLLKYVEKTNIPTIVSTGMADIKEVDKCVQIFNNNPEKLCLLKCTSDYPAKLNTTHLGQMRSLRERYNLPVGLSDHSSSNIPSIIATTLNATVIEKHFILNKNIKSLDSFFSLDEKEFTSLVNDIRSTKAMLERTNLNKLRQNVEAHSLWERPSIYYSRNLKKGENINSDCLLIRRPSLGLHPSNFEDLIGKKMKCNVTKYQPASFEHILK